jgi:transposase
MNTKQNGSFTPEFIRQALALADQIGVGQAGKDLGIRPNNIYRWRKQLATDGKDAFRGKGRMTPEAAELARLRRENAELRAERDILKKAATYFASQK